MKKLSTMRALPATILAAAIASTVSAAAVAAPHGSVQFYTDQAAFEAALGVPLQLTTENFDGGAPVGPFPTLCNEPMSTNSNDVCFTPGQLVPGFEITSTSGSGIIIFPSGFLGPNAPTRSVGATNFADSTIVSFAPTVGAAAADVYGGLSSNPVDVEIFDESGNSLGTTVVQTNPSRDIGTFFGVISPTPIGKITLNAENGSGELIDNLEFRPAGLLPPALAKAFAPAAIAIGQTSTLTITLGNNGQPNPATLTADLVDNLPSGLVVADTPNASSDCTGATVTALAGAASVTLASGAAIPGSATCTVSVDVTSASAGVYANTIPAGALATDAGSNADAANATLFVSTGAGSTFPPGENFDEAFPPALPEGWVSSTTTGGSDWTTVTDYSDTAPSSAYASERLEVSDFTLDTPEFTPVAGQNVTFRHKYNLERRFDGAVLEISIDGGAFVDIVDAGGAFVTGGYSYTIFDGSGSPLTDRLAWTGDSQGFMTTTATLPAAAVGHATRLRFRTADDASQTADGDHGWWIDSIVLGVDAVPPTASVTPASLSFTVAPDATATDTLDLANASGSSPLTYSVETRGTANRRPQLVPYASLAKATGAASEKILVPREPATFSTQSIRAARQAAPWTPEGGLVFQVDDGSAETALGAGTQGPPPTEQAAVYMNRFSASDALVIHTISVFWPVGDGDLTGLQANLVVYYDADGDGDPTNAVRVGTDLLVPIAITGNFQTYDTDFSIPGSGDVYIGFVDQWALAGGFTPRLFPAALDESPSQNMSYISSSTSPPVDIVDLGNNDINGTIFDVEQGSLDGNFMIRATATGGGGSGACTGPIVSWLSATPSAGSIEGGADASVTVTANPSAAGLAPGDYTAELCIVTNDPAHSVIAVPVSLTVTGTPPATPCSGNDEIFCDGFDPAQNGGSIVSGTLDEPVVENADGSAFDFATGDYHGYDGSITTDDINLYELIGGPGGDGMYVYWYGDMVPPDFQSLVGGVVDAGGSDFAVLHSGDTVGPASTVSGASTLMASWIGGADGYVGIAFYNESTGAVNYGYLHLTTAGSLGFPAQVLDWAYDKSGAAITIP